MVDCWSVSRLLVGKFKWSLSCRSSEKSSRRNYCNGNNAAFNGRSINSAKYCKCV